MNIVKIIFALALVNTFTFGAPAIGGERTFTQPDGTEFHGVLRGDSSFNWIESRGRVVKLNPTDKFYYNMLVDEKRGFLFTKDKASKSSKQAKNIKHSISKDDRKRLRTLQKKVKVGNYPR